MNSMALAMSQVLRLETEEWKMRQNGLHSLANELRQVIRTLRREIDFAASCHEPYIIDEGV